MLIHGSGISIILLLRMLNGSPMQASGLELVGRTSVSPPIVWGLSFSPDGRHVAMGLSEPQGSAEIVVVRSTEPGHVLRRFTVPWSVPLWKNDPRYHIRWSTSGKSLWVTEHPTIYHLGDDREDPPAQEVSARSVSPDGRLIYGFERSAFLVRDAATMTVATLIRGDTINPNAIFVGNDHICCACHSSVPVVICYELPSGKSTAVQRGWSPLGWSSGGTRLAISDYHPNLFRIWMANFFDLGGGIPTQFRKRLIWDIASDKVLASWKPPEQQEGNLTRRFAFALSPDGTLLAEGSLGSVSLFKVR